MEIDIDKISLNPNYLHHNVNTNFNHLANHPYTISYVISKT